MESAEEVGSPVERSQAPTTKQRECSQSFAGITTDIDSVVQLQVLHRGMFQPPRDFSFAEIRGVILNASEMQFAFLLL